MGFKAVFKSLQDVFPQVDIRILKAAAIEHSKDADSAVEFILLEVLPFIKEKKPSDMPPTDIGKSSLTEAKAKESPSKSSYVDTDQAINTSHNDDINSTCLNEPQTDTADDSSIKSVSSSDNTRVNDEAEKAISDGQRSKPIVIDHDGDDRVQNRFCTVPDLNKAENSASQVFLDPANSPSKISYSPTSPSYSPDNTLYAPAIPAYYRSYNSYSPTMPAYPLTSTGYTNYAYVSTIPSYSLTSPGYTPTVPGYSPTIPSYSATIPSHSPTSPGNSSACPSYSTTIPSYSPTSPDYSLTSPGYSSTAPGYSLTAPGSSLTGPGYSLNGYYYNPTSGTYVSVATQEYASTATSFPTSPLNYTTQEYAENKMKDGIESTEIRVPEVVGLSERASEKAVFDDLINDASQFIDSLVDDDSTAFDHQAEDKMNDGITSTEVRVPDVVGVSEGAAEKDVIHDLNDHNSQFMVNLVDDDFRAPDNQAEDKLNDGITSAEIGVPEVVGVSERTSEKAVFDDLIDDDSQFIDNLVLVDEAFDNQITDVEAVSKEVSKMDLLEDAISKAKNNKKTLFSSMESVINLMREVEHQEQVAEQAKEEAVTGGLDILEKADGIKQLLQHAKEANDMHSGEVYGEKAILSTEARELQSRLLNLSDERDNSLAILDEMHEALEARLVAVEEARKAAEQEKLEKEECARRDLAEQELIMDKVVEEAKRIEQEAEENSKLRSFLMNRGRVVDTLQGEIAVICKDVKLLKENFDGRLPMSKILSSSQTSCLLASSSSSDKSTGPIMTSCLLASSNSSGGRIIVGSDMSPEHVESIHWSPKNSGASSPVDVGTPRSNSCEIRTSGVGKAALVDDGWEFCDDDNELHI